MDSICGEMNGERGGERVQFLFPPPLFRFQFSRRARSYPKIPPFPLARKVKGEEEIRSAIFAPLQLTGGERGRGRGARKISTT